LPKAVIQAALVGLTCSSDIADTAGVEAVSRKGGHVHKPILLLLSACWCAGCATDVAPPAAAAPAASERPALGLSVSGQPLAPLMTAADQHALLESDDPKLARNKRHVYDFWRIVYEAGHMDQAAEFMTPEYIQHNPNVESGRDAFVRTMSVARPERPVEEVSRFPIIDIIAERDIVMVMWARKVRDREKPDEIYEMTWFDVFRLDEESGLIAEHWDSSERWGSAGRPPGAEFFP
jgi:predicted SnoaL-like aldol condensation-catalyzing enzyme